MIKIILLLINAVNDNTADIDKAVPMTFILGLDAAMKLIDKKLHHNYIGWRPNCL
jgi:hypothetical protein